MQWTYCIRLPNRAAILAIEKWVKTAKPFKFTTYGSPELVCLLQCSHRRLELREAAPRMRMDKLTIKAAQALQESQHMATEQGHAEISPLHLLAALTTPTA